MSVVRGILEGMTQHEADAQRGVDANPPTVPHGIPEFDEKSITPEAERPEVIIITGMSGAGRTRAASVLEDLDWYVVDNLPPRLLLPLAHMMTPTGGGVHRLAAVVDVRSRAFFQDLVTTLPELTEADISYRIVFLDASDEALVRRYESVRRPHPLQGDGRLMDGINKERHLLEDLHKQADALIDTSNMSVHDLARAMRDLVASEADGRIKLSIMSFGFKYGLPMDADHVIDVRFLKNPYWVSELRHLTGRDEAVRDYVLGQEGAQDFADKYVNLIAPILAGYERELKPFVTVAVGCTGGKHRSVAMTEEIARQLRELGQHVRAVHRDLGRE